MIIQSNSARELNVDTKAEAVDDDDDDASRPRCGCRRRCRFCEVVKGIRWPVDWARLGDGLTQIS